MSSATFLPHPFFRGGHAQTLAGFLARPEPFVERATLREVSLADGDRIVLHDDRPNAWNAGGPVALLIHGLAGCHASPYMQRIARKLGVRGTRTFRMDLRGCGAGLALARYPYHSGRSEDAAAALREIDRLCPGSPVSLIGFSLGGNITLKLLGEAPEALPANLARAMAVCPPVDLFECVTALGRGVNRLYDRYFARLLRKQVAARRQAVPDAVVPDDWPAGSSEFGIRSAESQVDATSAAERRRSAMPAGNGSHRPPRGVLEFDQQFTAPVSGYGTAENYYRLCSSAQFVPAIRIPTLILAAADDPLVPGGAFERLSLPPCVELHLTRHGGHLGYISRSTGDPDRHWMDWRVVDWCLGLRATGCGLPDGRPRSGRVFL